ncbi:unnamed protein product [Kluyveromyces dobzhanskii CBS 2104]|uniref:Trafficking protein particle complex subunit n=1 Tax=Kluyveromyces dobzhanskii CBS 2104 TaxID=1427455 RepID=A0A0A8L061_9SACH|nr:unnamed protein product [Kluyveromyces dobzhanskii CBS 2104]
MIYSLWIFDRHNCIFDKEYTVNQSTSIVNSKEQQSRGKLIYGMIHSLKSMSTKIAPGNMLRTLTTGKYRIHALFTASNLWIVIFSDLTHHELHETLDRIYELYLKYVVHNMLKPIDFKESAGLKESKKITSPSFIRAVDHVLCL